MTNLFETEPSKDFQYPPLSSHLNWMKEVTESDASVVLLTWTPASEPTRLVPFLSSMMLSSTIRV